MGDLFFVASKSFWLLARPDSLLIALLALGLWMLRPGGAPRLGRRLVAAGLLGFVGIGLAPLQSLLLAPLETRFPARPAVAAPAGIVLLGGSEDLAAAARSGMPQVNQGGDRYLATLALALRYPEARVIFAGGGAQFRTAGGEARMSERLLLEGGLDPTRLLLESRSRNTAENARFARALVAEQPEGPWLLVTSAAHMPRAVGTFCAAGWTGIVPYPVDQRAQRLRPMWNPAGNLNELHAAAREWVGLLAYRLTGRTETLWPAGCPPQ